MIAEEEQTRVAFRVPASLIDALERVAEKEERTLSAEIRFLIRRRVEESEGLPKQGAGS